MVEQYLSIVPEGDKLYDQIKQIQDCDPRVIERFALSLPVNDPNFWQALSKNMSPTQCQTTIMRITNLLTSYFKTGDIRSIHSKANCCLFRPTYPTF